MSPFCSARAPASNPVHVVVMCFLPLHCQPGISIRFGCASASSAISSNRAQPDVLCLQETKCIDDAFPQSAFTVSAMGIRAGQRAEGLSRRRRGLAAPFAEHRLRTFCGKYDLPSHRGFLRRAAQLATASWCTISTCRPAATFPIPRSTRSSRTSSPSRRAEVLADRRRNGTGNPSSSATSTSRRMRTTSGRTSRPSALSATRR